MCTLTVRDLNSKSNILRAISRFFRGVQCRRFVDDIDFGYSDDLGYTSLVLKTVNLNEIIHNILDSGKTTSF